MNGRFVDLGGPVFVADFGGEGPSIVCVHGLGGSHENWVAAGPMLARAGRVVAPDLAGHGRTPPAGRSASLPGNAALIARFLEEIAREPAILVGNSMGGLLSIMVAADRPELVAGLVLVDPALPRARRAAPDPLVAAAFTAYTLPGVGERFIARRRVRLGPERLVRETLALCCADPSRVRPDVVDALVALARERMEMPWADTAFLAAARAIVRTVALRERYYRRVDRITAPTLVVHGALDRLVPKAAALELARRRPDWTLAVLDGIGHVPQLEDPDGFARVVLGWLEGTGRAAALAAGG